MQYNVKSTTVSIDGLAYRYRSNAPPSQQQHPREYGGAVRWWVVVGVMGM